MKNICVTVLVLAFSLICAGPARADRVICTDGTVYEGIIVSENTDTITMEIPVYPIRVTVFRGAVKGVERGSSAQNRSLRDKINEVKKQRGFVE